MAYHGVEISHTMEMLCRMAGKDSQCDALPVMPALHIM